MTVSHDAFLQRTDERAALVGVALGSRASRWPRVAGAAAALVVGFVAGSLAMPSQVKTSSQVVIKADPALVYAHMAAPGAWGQWAGNTRRGVRLIGPEVGTGAGMSFNVGGERHRLIVSEAGPRTGVSYSVVDEAGEVTETGLLALSVDSGTTTVSWRVSRELGWSPLARFGGPAQATAEQARSDAALQRLRALAEADHQQAFNPATVENVWIETTGNVPMGPGLSMEFD